MNFSRWTLMFLSISIVLTYFIWVAYTGIFADSTPMSSFIYINPFLSTSNSTEFPDNDSSSSSNMNSTEYRVEENTDTSNWNKTDVTKRAKNENAESTSAPATHDKDNTTSPASAKGISRGGEISAGNSDANESGTPKMQANQNKPYITVRFKGRLGNQMLQYAALFAVSRRSSVWTPVLVKRGRRFGLLLDAFRESLSIPVANFSLQEAAQFKEDTDADVTIERLRDLPPKNVTLSGFFQSHKFFEDAKYELRREFAFPADARRRVFAYFRNVTPAAWRRQRFVRVGVHVRRRSLITAERRAMGFVPRPPSYYAHAMAYFRRNYGRVQFIVTGDDLPWCRENVRGENVVYSENNSAEFDLGILAHSDHVITCMGTYSWWAGWLCNGTTIYYGVMPPKGTYLEVIYANNKWVPPPDDKYNHWIPIS